MTSTSASASPPSDADLLQAICTDDMYALQTLFDRYRTQIYQTALGVVRDPHLAEEVLQDCLYRLYRYADRIDGSTPIAPWLYRVTVNLCYSRLKTRRRHWAESFHDMAERLRASSRSQPEQVAEHHEMQAVIRATLERLSPQHRAVLVLHYFHDYSLAEIASILECPEGTIKSRLFYARKVLKDQLQRAANQEGLLPDLL